MTTKLWTRAFAVATVAGLTFAACGQQGPAASAAPTTAASAAATSAAPVAKRGTGGELKILYWQAATILNTHLAQGTKDYDAGRLVLEPLASMGPDGKPVANLAAEVPTISNNGVSKDLTTVTWKLKTGVKWSDGSDFTADDVLFTYKFQTDKETGATDAGTADGIKSVDKVDANTIKVTYAEPNPNFYQWGVSGLSNILQKKQFEPCLGAKAKDCPGNSKPIGTGPYKIDDFKPNDVVVYSINDQYRDKNAPFFTRVTFKGGGDATSAARAVCQTGESDYSWNLQVEATILKPMLDAGDSKCVFSSATSPNVERLLLNRTNPDASLGDKRGEPDQPHPFLSDLKVRKALAMAVDRKAMADLYGGGLTGEPTCNIVTGTPEIASKNTASLDICKFDVAAANKLLDEAGATKGSDGKRSFKGKPMKIVYQTTVNTLRQKEQEIVKNGWSQLGIDVELKSVPAGTFFGREGNDTAGKFFTDVEMFTNGAESPDPQNYLLGWTTAEIKTKAANWSGNNYERYSSKDYDDTFAQLKKEADPAKRNALAIKLNDLLVQDVVLIPLIARKQPTDGASKQLKGVKPNPWDSVLWNLAEWTK